MIVANNLSKKFDDFTAVNRVNLDVGAGEVLALLGPNGAGKTTTVRMLTSVLKPTSGSAIVAGYDVITEAKNVRSSVGVLTEHHGLYDRMKALDYLDFFGQLHGMDKESRKLRSNDLLDKFGLLQDADRRIGEYSKGMRQKLALARALLHNPPVLLLDEPTSAMDPESAKMVREAILELRSGDRSVIICTHNLMEAELLSDRIAIIRRGSIIAGGSPNDLKDELLGPVLFEAKLSEPMNGIEPDLPAEINIVDQGRNWLRFRSKDADKYNPIALQKLLEQGFKVSSLQEVPRSLEQVYLEAVTKNNGESEHVK